MNTEELAYANQQLAAMLRDGLPLAGALRELAATMGSGELRTELQALESDLAAGRSVAEAVSRRRLPPLYSRLLIAGSRGGDLPAALTLAADHFGALYQRQLRLRTLLIYPALVVLTGLGVTILIAVAQNKLSRDLLGDGSRDSMSSLLTWILPAAFGLIALFGIALAALPPLRRWFAWRCPGIREDRVANLSASVGLMLRQNCPLPEALAVAREIEDDPRIRTELDAWLDHIARGEPPLRPASDRTVLPALLPWLATTRAADLGEGFLRAAEFFHRRAVHRLDLLVNGALPVSLVLLGAVAGVQLFIILSIFAGLLDSLGGFE
ncbi:MAG: type II secretion system F family protein [Verrucomicrobiales bacterium]|nr:type II secretion system F family protein [Verrucomicrobiales bacterium]